MSGAVTRSRSSKFAANGNSGKPANGMNGTNGVGESRKNGAVTNGNHGREEALKSDNGCGGRSFLDTLLNSFVLPISLLVFTPQLVMVYWYTATQCNGSYAILLGKVQESSVLNVLVEIWSSVHIINKFTVSVVFGYFAWAIFWMKVLPGKKVYGPVTPKGNTPEYVDNGFSHYVVTMIGLIALTVVLKQYGYSPTVVYDRFGDLIAFMNVFALVFVFLLYLKGRFAPSSTDSGCTGRGFIFDYYWGTELYPRVFGVDIKVLTNCRFGMTVWPVLVYIYALKSYELHGFVDSMFVTTILQLTYITKFFTWESGYMGTIDIILDRAGFYICWGCLSWLPALYPIVSQYLVIQPIHLGPVWSSVILGLGLASVLVNYLADRQRQEVRKAGGECLVWGKKPVIIKAKYRLESGEERGSILLASGWWGLARHFHYIPEIMLSFFWTLPCGFSNLLPYTYVIVLVVLLVHRSFRDENKCSKKYGVFWQKYCNMVPYRIVPFLF